MNKHIFKKTAAFLAIVLIMTGNPAAVYAAEEDILLQDITVDDEGEDILIIDDSEVLPSVSQDHIEDADTDKETEVWEGSIPEEDLNYRDIDFKAESSDVGYNSLTGRTDLKSILPHDRVDSIPDHYPETLDPARFNLPPVRDQDPFGTCWAFSTLTSCEISLARKYGISPSLLDMSERALCYFFYDLEGIDDPLGNTLNDYNTPILGDSHDIYESGGNVQLASFFLMNWGGPVDEPRAPYTGLVEIGKYGDLTKDAQHKGADKLNDALCYDSDYHVQNVRFIPYSEKDDIKRAIMDNGVVSISYYHSSSYYNPGSYAYHTNRTDNTTNHAVTIVGWDDGFSKDKFKIKPENNGAWLIRNSYGNDFGNGGYFWISYEEKSFSDATVISCEPGNNYDNNYFYDGAANLNDFGLAGDGWKAANVYKTFDNEVLRAVSFAASTSDISYSIQIYKNLTDASIPSSGQAMLERPVTGITGYAGSYTIPLPTPVHLDRDDTFAVEITIGNSGGEQARLFVEHDWEANWLRCNADIKQGQSFIKYSDASSWIDMSRAEACFRIHAFTDTDDFKAYLVESDRQGEISRQNIDDISSEVSFYDLENNERYYSIEDATKAGDLQVTSSDPNILEVGAARQKGNVRQIELKPLSTGQVILTVGSTGTEKSITVNVFKPVITVTTVSKVDELYIPEIGKGQISVGTSTGRITDVKLVDTNRNGKTGRNYNPLAYIAETPDIAPDGLSADVDIRIKPDGNAGFCNGSLYIYLEGITDPVIKDISIAHTRSIIRYSAPSPIVYIKNNRVTEGNKIDITFRNITAQRIEEFNSPVIRLTDKKGRSINNRYTATYSDGVLRIVPRTGIPFKTKSEDISISISDNTHRKPYTISRLRLRGRNKKN